MDINIVTKFGKGVAIVTMVIGLLLTIQCAITRNVEAITFLYFYIVLAGIFNAVIFLSILLFSLSYRAQRKSLITTAAIVLFNYLVLLGITYFLIF
jgi:hypothetical protein